MSKDTCHQAVAEIEQLLTQKDFKGAMNVIERLIEVEYKEGYKHAVSNYAIWKNGEQFVGVMQRPLKAVLKEVDESSVPILY